MFLDIYEYGWSEVKWSCSVVSDSLWPHGLCSPPGSSVHGNLQARILEWVAISFSRGSSRPRDQTHVSRIAGRCFNLWATREALWTWVNVKVKSLRRVRLFATPWTIAHQASPSMGISRQEYWSGLPFPSPGDLPDPGIKPRSPALQADTLTSELPWVVDNISSILASSGVNGTSTCLYRCTKIDLPQHGLRFSILCLGKQIALFSPFFSRTVSVSSQFLKPWVLLTLLTSRDNHECGYLHITPGKHPGKTLWELSDNVSQSIDSQVCSSSLIYLLFLFCFSAKTSNFPTCIRIKRYSREGFSLPTSLDWATFTFTFPRVRGRNGKRIPVSGTTSHVPSSHHTMNKYMKGLNHSMLRFQVL